MRCTASCGRLVGRADRPLAPATVRRIHGIIHRALGQGVRWGWVAKNPAAQASPPRVSAPRIEPPSPADVAKLIELAAGCDAALAAFLFLAAVTGARRSELVALRWADLDLERGAVEIRRGVVVGRHGIVEKDTKTHAVRRVSLDPAAVQYLVAHRGRSQDVARSVGLR
jgi:integrase